MGKATIIEAQNSQTVFEESKSNGILGHLKGVFADYKNGTRNSDRLYTEELWDNRVFGSEDVMEALETKTLFGELDHPEGDRCETLAKNAAISITKLEKRPDEGVIYGEAEILDTPTGRIVKALADSGAKLGISSRGMGEEVYVDGQNIIDPETYDFITFDVVVTPANTKARVSLTESKAYSKLTENFKKEIEESETENQLNQLKTVIENVNMSNKTELVDLIKTKIEKFKKPVSNKLTEANRQIALDLLSKKYETMKIELAECKKATESLAEENKKLIEEKEFLSNSREMLKCKLKEAKEVKADDTEKEVKKELDELKESYSKLIEENKALKTKRIEDNQRQRELALKTRQMNNVKTENIENKYKEELSKLQESVNEKNTELSKLTEAKAESDRKVEEYSKILVENKKLLDRVHKLEENVKVSQTKLQESKLNENKKIIELQNQVKELQRTNNKMTEAQDRFAKLSFNPIGTVKAIKENFSSEDFDEEDAELYNALIGQ